MIPLPARAWAILAGAGDAWQRHRHHLHHAVRIFIGPVCGDRHHIVRWLFGGCSGDVFVLINRDRHPEAVKVTRLMTVPNSQAKQSWQTTLQEINGFPIENAAGLTRPPSAPFGVGLGAQVGTGGLRAEASTEYIFRHPRRGARPCVGTLSVWLPGRGGIAFRRHPDRAAGCRTRSWAGRRRVPVCGA